MKLADAELKVIVLSMGKLIMAVSALGRVVRLYISKVCQKQHL